MTFARFFDCAGGAGSGDMPRGVRGFRGQVLYIGRQFRLCRDHCTEHTARQFGAFGAKREISTFERVRGGGRSRHRTCLTILIPC
jgi:hypothetical protein